MYFNIADRNCKMALFAAPIRYESRLSGTDLRLPLYPDTHLALLLNQKIVANDVKQVNNLKASFPEWEYIMRLRDIAQIVDGTSDPAFAVDGLGCIVAWNQKAAEIFGVSSVDAIGRPCYEMICGMDDGGTICSSECVIRRPVNKGHLINNFDLRITTPSGRNWFNISVIVINTSSAVRPYTIHILRSVDLYKRLELLLRDFVIGKTDVTRAQAAALISSRRSPASTLSLTKREAEILKMVANSGTSVAIAKKLHISATTVDNHLQHILKKLSAHSRLEAVLRAEHAGLL